MRKLVLVALAAPALLAVACFVAWAQEASLPNVGTVDLDFVGTQFKKKLRAEEDLNRWFQAEQRKLQQLDLLFALNADEWTEAVALVDNDNRSEAENQRLQTLTKNGTDRGREWKNLRDKPDRTEEENTRFGDLDEFVKARAADLDRRVEGLEQELATKKEELGRELMEPVRQAIESIAEEKGLTLIVDKKVVYLGGDDITELVIEQLNADEPDGPTPTAEGGTDANAPGETEETPGDTPAEGGGNP